MVWYREFDSVGADRLSVFILSGSMLIGLEKLVGATANLSILNPIPTIDEIFKIAE